VERGAKMSNVELFRREQYLSKIRGFYHDTDIIKVITGVRRCGKSSLMEMIKDELIATGVKEEQIIYLDLDSRKYRKIKNDDEFEKIVDELSVANEIKYLFVDEIQNIRNFE
jgi:predicted AAA+ superfamily ATPase